MSPFFKNFSKFVTKTTLTNNKAKLILKFLKHKDSLETIKA